MNQIIIDPTEWARLESHISVLERDNAILHQQLQDALHNPPRAKQIHNYVSEALNEVVAHLDDSAKPLPTLKSKLGSNFTKFGSDKNSRHSYAEIYAGLIGSNREPRILEIGLGSVNGFPYGGLEPGGSIRAWRETYPECVIVGADIDAESVDAIVEPGFVVDQTNSQSLASLALNLEPFGKFDLVVDDGFHEIHANVRTLFQLISLVRPGGYYVVEDIHESLIPLWRAITPILPGSGQIVDLRQMRTGVEDNVLYVISL